MSQLSDCPSKGADLRKQVGQRETTLSHLSDQGCNTGVFQPTAIRSRRRSGLPCTARKVGGSEMGNFRAKPKSVCQHAVMSWEMALEYIRTLIWPAVTLTLGFTFRRQLSSLFGRLQSLETPLGTAAFDRQAAAVAQEAAEIESEIADEVAAAEIEKPDSVDAEEDRSPQNEDSTLLHFVGNRRSSPENTFADLLNRAQTQTTEAVLAAWR